MIAPKLTIEECKSYETHQSHNSHLRHDLRKIKISERKALFITDREQFKS